jgi:rhodanese-related sulfurtransferase
MKAISPAELQSLLARDAALLVVDVSTPAEFAGSHVPQARNVPLDKFDSKAVPANQPVYLLCRSGTRAVRAAGKIANGIVVEGGTQAWIAAGLQVTRGASKVISLERQVRIAAGSLVLTGVILGWRVHPGFFGLSAFVGAGLVFAGITDFCGMGLLLARAPWNQCTGC